MTAEPASEPVVGSASEPVAGSASGSLAGPVPDAAGRTRLLRALRIRYAVLGLVLAALWVGRSGEPAWEHALRTVAVMLTIRPLLRVTLRYRLRELRSQASASRYVAWLIAIRLTMVGAALGVSWLIGYLLDPAHRHATVRALVLRLALLALTIPLQLYVERRHRGPGHAAASPMLWRRFITAKVGLVLVALGAEVLLQHWLGPRADLVVAAGLFVTVTLLGPWVHRRYLTGASPRQPRVLPGLSGSPVNARALGEGLHDNEGRGGRSQRRG